MPLSTCEVYIHVCPDSWMYVVTERELGHSVQRQTTTRACSGPHNSETWILHTHVQPSSKKDLCTQCSLCKLLKSPHLLGA